MDASMKTDEGHKMVAAGSRLSTGPGYYRGLGWGRC